MFVYVCVRACVCLYVRTCTRACMCPSKRILVAACDAIGKKIGTYMHINLERVVGAFGGWVSGSTNLDKLPILIELVSE